MNQIYFDYCASTPLYPEVSEKIMEISEKIYANPSSMNNLGFKANKVVTESRAEIADCLNVKEEEIIFTSGATESNNLAIFGLINSLRNNTDVKSLHVITSTIEHASVLNCFKKLEEYGVEVTYIPVDSNGIVDLQLIEKSIKINTVLISIMHVNNETGAIQPIDEIGEIIKKNSNAYFHVDGVQGFGKVYLDLNNIDMYTISGHKIGASKGIGILMVKESTPISPLLYGGDQEMGLRPGTSNVPGIVGIKEAIKISLTERENRFNKLEILHNHLFDGIESRTELTINSRKFPLSSPHIINFSYSGVPSALFLHTLAKDGIIASAQSACSSMKNESRILMAINKNKAIASSSIRISLHEEVNISDINYLIKTIHNAINLISSNKVTV